MHRVRRYGTLGGLIGIIVVFSILLPDTFLSGANLINVSRQISMLAVVAFTMTIVMAMGDFDLSVGSMASLAGITAGVLFMQGYGIALAVPAALLVGIAGGLLNGWFVAYLGILPFVATLGTLTVYSGAAFYISGGKTLFGSDIPTAFSQFSRLGIPLESVGLSGLMLPSLTLLALTTFGLVWLLLERKAFGRHLYVIGCNHESARVAGIAVKRLRLLAFGLTGGGAALAGLMLSSRVASANPTLGAGLMLDAIAAVFLGMTVHRDGAPHVSGTLVGVLLLGILDNGLTQLSVDSYIRQMLVGLIVIVAVAVSGHRQAGH